MDTGAGNYLRQPQLLTAPSVLINSTAATCQHPTIDQNVVMAND